MFFVTPNSDLFREDRKVELDSFRRVIRRMADRESQKIIAQLPDDFEAETVVKTYFRVPRYVSAKWSIETHFAHAVKNTCGEMLRSYFPGRTFRLDIRSRSYCGRFVQLKVQVMK